MYHFPVEREKLCRAVKVAAALQRSLPALHVGLVLPFCPPTDHGPPLQVPRPAFDD